METRPQTLAEAANNFNAARLRFVLAVAKAVGIVWLLDRLKPRA